MKTIRHTKRCPLGFAARALLIPMTIALLGGCAVLGWHRSPEFHVIAFYTGKNDQAHISFDHEAGAWFTLMGKKHGFSYTATQDWSQLNARVLSRYQVVMFLDARPEDSGHRKAFETYMRDGGAWMGFHFSAFALTPSAYPMNWDWYHDQFLGSGAYRSNTWRPTSAVLRVEDHNSPATRHLPDTFTSQPNEWYRWENDLRKDSDIRILVSIDPVSFPVGTGPKPSEIWHQGYYPVVWTNRRYRMIYFNMGHNDMDYAHRYGPKVTTLSHTFGGRIQNRMILDALLALGRGRWQ